MNRITPDQIIEQARIAAGQSRDRHATQIYRRLGLVPGRKPDDDQYVAQMNLHMHLVMESFLIGAAMALKLLHGDGSPEPMESNRRERLHELLRNFGLLQSDCPECAEPNALHLFSCSRRALDAPPSVIPSTSSGSSNKGE